MPRREDTIVQLLEKTSHFDKDERYMATSDLCVELNKTDVQLALDLERKVCAAILKQLDDKSNDVQSIAVKCLGILVTKVAETQVRGICEKLSDLILTGTSELRDIYSIGLKTILADVSHATGTSIALPLSGNLLRGLSDNMDQSVKSEILDILTDLLRRFGHEVMSEHESIMKLVIAQLQSSSALVRKRASACLGSLGVVASESLLDRLVEHLIQSVSTSKDIGDMRTLIQTIGTLSRTVGHRLGRHLDRIVPLFLQFCGDPDDESLQNEASSELRENCLQGLESFVMRCHTEITPHIPRILEAVMKFMKYDPNYNYGESDDDDVSMDESIEDDYSDQEEGDYSDDDDTSWKVRRAAILVLTAIIVSRPEMLGELYKTCSDPLISRFKEREENVRIDVFNVFSDLLEVTNKTITPRDNKASSAFGNSSDVCLQELERRLGVIIDKANKQLAVKCTVSSRCAVVSMLTHLARVAHGKLGSYGDEFLPNVFRAMEDRHSDLKLDALHFLQLLLDSHEPQTFQKHMDAVVPIAVECTRGDWYKIVAKALALIGSIVRVIRPANSSFPHKKFVLPLFEAVLPRLKAHDIDQEIKEGAITSTGEIVASLGDELGDRINEVLPLLMDRLQNEITRIHAMKALSAIACSKLNLDITLVLRECVATISQLLRQQSRTLKQASLDALIAIIKSKGTKIPSALLCEVLSEASALIVDSDLQLCRLAIMLVLNALVVCPSLTSEPAFTTRVLPQALQLASSALLQGPTLEVLKELFGHLTKSENGAGSCGFLQLFEALFGSFDESKELPKHALLNLARCIATICLKTSKAHQKMAFKSFVDAIRTSKSDRKKTLCLYSLGEFGRQVNMKDFVDVKDTILGCFESDEQVKSAAAYAIGNICVGNMQSYLDTIIEKLDGGVNSYLLLSSLREVIAFYAAHDSKEFSSSIDRILPVLKKLGQRDEDGVRNMVAECLGKLAIIDPARLLPVIMELCRTCSPHSRWTGVTSLKYSISCATAVRPTQQLSAHIQVFLESLKDDDLSVRRAALVTLNTAAHHEPSLLAPYVKDVIFPQLLAAMDLKLERVVDLGPFKHKVDDGLSLRKAAYACMDNLFQSCPAQVDLSSLFPFMEKGLRDHEDIQVLCHQMLVRICHVKPGSILGALDLIVDPLDKTVHKKVKQDQVGTEVERLNDLIRSALRAIYAISCVRDTDTHPKFRTLHHRITQSDKLNGILESIQTERFEN